MNKEIKQDFYNEKVDDLYKKFNSDINGISADVESVDVLEIDAASNNGVDHIRALREEAGYLPAELKYKVYIVDEVHMLSTGAFNALLKILEEPPPHVIFILATTDTHKIPATILSRCQRFDFHRINSEESADRLIAVAEKEGITLERDAAMLIARLSDGGMRDALSLLDVAASENTVITQDVIRDCAGIAGKEHLFAITDAIAGGDGKAALTITAELYAKSKDPTRLIDELLQHFRNLMIVKLMPGEFSLLTVLQEEIPDYNRQAEMFTIESIMDCLDKLEDCLRLKGRKVEAEICLMRLCIGSGQTIQHTPPSPPSPSPLPPPSLPTEPPLPEPPPPPEPLPEPPVQAQRINPSPTNVLPQWKGILKKLDPFKAAMLEEAHAGISGNTIVITGSSTLEYFFDNPDNLAAIERAARESTGTDYKVVFDKPEPAPDHAQSAKPIKIEQFLDDVKSSGVQITIN